MANPKGNPDTLKSFKPKWRSGKTKTFRFPIAIADNINEAARELDKNGNVSLLQVIEQRKVLDTDKEKAPFTVTSDREKLKTAFEEAVAVPSNRGGQIKKAIAVIGELVGLNIQKTGKGWTISDTSEL